ncbi:hypothetical protein H0H93_016256 [Arthromyces matolae]|nr:hypothetical protein H0H93_016256 [Arthromyces matolae]
MFPSPDDFRPERFLETSNPRLQAFELPFGFGRRICPGMHLALNSLFINVSRILWAFDILPALDDNGFEVIPAYVHPKIHGTSLMDSIPGPWLNLRRAMPPGPLGIPFVGNIHQVPTVKPWLKWFEWSRQYGPVISYLLGSTPVIVLNTANAAWDLLEKRSEFYSSRPRSPSTFRSDLVEGSALACILRAIRCS